VVALALCLNAVGSGRPAGAEDACRISLLGDSLTSGYGVAQGQAFPAVLEAALRADGFTCEVIDAGVSGDTSAGGRSRLPWVLADRPSHLLVELGGNDGLRALPVTQLEANLAAIIQDAQGQGIKVFLAGMLAPPNLGRDYTEAFRRVYEDLAARYDVPLYPFFLEGIVMEPQLMQASLDLPSSVVVRILPTAC
jgi:acyl-CoA thioesterase-1